jgi:hypothetical protein
MSNREVAGLQALAKKHGGNLSVNPDTGLPEAGFLDSILPTIAGAGLAYFGVNPMMAAGIVGGIKALDSKDLSQGLMAGLGAYGGAGLTEGLMGVGASQLGGAAAAQQTAAEQLADAGAGRGAYIPDDAIARAAAPSNFDKLGAGAGQLFSNPGQTLQAIGGGSGYKTAGMLGAAAAPIIADEMVETTTEAPPQDRGKIRPYTYSRQQIPQAYQGQQGNMGSKERRYFNESYTAGDPYSAAGGGLVALAAGGYTNQNIFRPTTPLPANNMYGASRDAYDYLMGANPPSGGGQTRPYNPYPMEDIRIDDGKNLNPSTPKTGTGRYEYDPVTKQYKWIPDPIKPVDVAAPVFEAPVRNVGGGGRGQTAAEREAEANEPNAMLNGLSQNEYNALSPFERNAAAAQAAKDNPIKDFIGKAITMGPLFQLGQALFGTPNPTEDPQHQAIVNADAEQRALAQTGSPLFSGNPYFGDAKAAITGDGPVVSVSPPTGIAEGFNYNGLDGGSNFSPTADAKGDATGGYGSAEAARDAAGRDPGNWHDAPDSGGSADAKGGYLQHGQFDQRMAHGGIANLHQYNLGSYSDGGRLLKGPGDGVSDDIPATIGHGQPARLADGEFVIPARIVSEIGNGSTDAGARELYKMMDRIQAGRRKTVGKDQVARNSKAVRHLPA